MNTTPISPEMIQAGFEAFKEVSPGKAHIWVHQLAAIYTAMHSASQGVQGDVEMLRAELEKAGSAIRELRLADAYAARTGNEGRFDRALHELCQRESFINEAMASLGKERLG